MVVFEDGLAKKADYRKFKVKTVAGNDDYAAMEEVLRRRLTALLAERSAGPTAGRRRFAYPPQLLLLDGGKGQLGVGEQVVAELGLTTEIDLAALAKQYEEVYRPKSPVPVRVPRGSEALYLLQRVRDEAHRFAITYHRQRRGSRMTSSVLEAVPGMGPTRRARLLKEIGGVRALRAATVEDLRGLSWLPDEVADAVYEALHGAGRPGPPGVSQPGPSVRETGG
jgi:excinuclease ABC subunit C